MDIPVQGSELIKGAALKPYKREVNIMIQNLRRAFHDVIRSSFSTRTREFRVLQTMTRKLDKITFSIGFPWQIEDENDLNTFYEDFPDTGNEFFTSWIYAANMKKQHELLNQNDVMFDASNTNVYYSGTRNQVIIPAAVMRPPFFYIEGIAAYNYAVLGHVSSISCLSFFSLKLVRHNAWCVHCQRFQDHFYTGCQI